MGGFLFYTEWRIRTPRRIKVHFPVHILLFSLSGSILAHARVSHLSLKGTCVTVLFKVLFFSLEKSIIWSKAQIISIL